MSDLVREPIDLMEESNEDGNNETEEDEEEEDDGHESYGDQEALDEGQDDELLLKSEKGTHYNDPETMILETISDEQAYARVERESLLVKSMKVIEILH